MSYFIPMQLPHNKIIHRMRTCNKCVFHGKKAFINFVKEIKKLNQV